MSNLVYESKYEWKHPMYIITMLLTLLQITLVLILICYLVNNIFLIGLIISISLFWIFRILKKQSIFRLYNDRIDFVNTLL